jgi:hypothetical protein
MLVIRSREHPNASNQPKPHKTKRGPDQFDNQGIPKSSPLHHVKKQTFISQKADKPLSSKFGFNNHFYGKAVKVVGQGRLELPTSRLSSARSNQLSY